MNRIALGTAQLGLDYGIGNTHGQISLTEGAAIIEFAKSHGMDTLDTAVAYGNSEQRLGQIGVPSWRIITKLPAVPADVENVAAWIHSTVSQSIARLQVSHLDGLLLHRPDQLLEPQGPAISRALCDLKNQGLVRKIGVSIYDPAELDLLIDKVPIELVQAPFNLLDRRLEQSGWLSRMVDCGIEVHVRSIFLQGLLLMQPAARDGRFARWNPLWSALQRWSADQALPPLEACLAHVLSYPEISRIVVGVDSQNHLAEILNAANRTPQRAPSELACSDVELLNPALWHQLQANPLPSAP
jgi:aryl-alcohol dehydrogenase-like predicted oxidoreductase